MSNLQNAADSIAAKFELSSKDIQKLVQVFLARLGS